MSEHVNALEGAMSSSASSVAVKTTVVGGTGLGAPAVIPFLQANHIWVFTLAEVCQLVATLWILVQLFILARAKILAMQKPEEKKQFNGPAIMGGNSGSGPGSSSGSSSSSGGGGNGPEEEQEEKE